MIAAAQQRYRTHWVRPSQNADRVLLPPEGETRDGRAEVLSLAVVRMKDNGRLV